MVDSTVGSSMVTGWKRRESAGSFSIVLRYSSAASVSQSSCKSVWRDDPRVVAPTSCNPRARAGLIMFPASIDPSALPRFNNVSVHISTHIRSGEHTINDVIQARRA